MTLAEATDWMAHAVGPPKLFGLFGVENSTSYQLQKMPTAVYLNWVTETGGRQVHCSI